MSFPFITAEQRLAEKRGSKGVILGPSGVGKTTLLKTADATRTLFIDLEAGDLAVLDWPGDSVRPRTAPLAGMPRSQPATSVARDPALRDGQILQPGALRPSVRSMAMSAMLARNTRDRVDSMRSRASVPGKWAKRATASLLRKNPTSPTRVVLMACMPGDDRL